ncbi:MAG: hydantoinase/oxoprolinase family protein [Fimbriiglobus sp.]
MPEPVLGFDIGGANLKAATSDKRATSLPYALWKNPAGLRDALLPMVAQFPDTDDVAVTMTGELCDCFTNKTEGVAHILKHVRAAVGSRRLVVWSTEGKFLNTEEANLEPMRVASANWHALATFAGHFLPEGVALLVDIGTTTTDIIPIRDGIPCSKGLTDMARLQAKELLYMGVKRTPLMAFLPPGRYAAEYFATIQDAFLVLGQIADNPADTDTADGRPATAEFAHARIARMLCGDGECIPRWQTEQLAKLSVDAMKECLESAIRWKVNETEVNRQQRDKRMIITSGSGEFALKGVLPKRIKEFSLREVLSEEVVSAAPAYAVAVLWSERR